MKKLLCFLLSCTMLLVFAGTALGATQSISLTYANVYNKDIDISNYEIRGTDRTKHINFEGRLVDYMVEKNLSIRLVFPVSKQELLVPAAAFINDDYTKLKASGENYAVRLELYTNGDSILYEYFKADQMGLKGLYAASETGIMLEATLLKAGRPYHTYKELAEPIKITSEYTWGVSYYEAPIRINAERLRYYYVADPAKGNVWTDYEWTYAGAAVNTEDRTVSVSAKHTGYYCALASESHTDTATDPSAVGEQGDFLDISNHWAKGNIEYLIKIAVIKNEGEYFYPSRNITRGEFAVYLTRVLGLAEDLSSAASFKDLNSNLANYKEIVTAASSGLVRGVSDGVFAPNNNITRQEMAAMMTRVLQKANKSVDVSGSSLETMADYQIIPAWALESCKVVNTIGLMGGKENNRFAPKDNTTKAEAAAILNRLAVHLK